MYYPKLIYASPTIEGVFLFGILCLSNKKYGLESLYYIGNFQILPLEKTKKSHWETPLLTLGPVSKLTKIGNHQSFSSNSNNSKATFSNAIYLAGNISKCLYY